MCSLSIQVSTWGVKNRCDRSRLTLCPMAHFAGNSQHYSCNACTTPPPPRDHKAENLPQWHPPESTKLHQFLAKSRTKIPGGMPPDPLNLRLLFAQRQIFISKIPQQSKIRAPLKKFLGTGLLKQWPWSPAQALLQCRQALVFSQRLYSLKIDISIPFVSKW